MVLMKNIYNINIYTIKYSYCFVVVVIIFALSCSERVTPNEKDLGKYPQLYPFVYERIYFRGLCFDMDTGVYEFVIRTGHNSKEQYFDSIDIKTKQYGWVLDYDNGSVRLYRPQNLDTKMNITKVSVEYKSKSEIYIRCN